MLRRRLGPREVGTADGCSATIRVNARDNLDEWFDRAPVAMIVAPDRPCNT
jgi:hypothetical protein